MVVCLAFLEICCASAFSPITDAVHLTQFPEDDVCSVQQLLCVCTTGGLAVLWIVNDNIYVFNNMDQINTKVEDNGFIFSLIDIELPYYFANATVESVLLKHNDTNVTFSDDTEFVPRDI